MPQWRKLYSKVVESIDVNAMPDDFTRLLWVLLPTQLCSEGRGQDHGAWVRAKVFPMRDDVSLEMIERAMACFEARGMIVRYKVDGRRFFEVVNWHKYQGNTSRETASDYPAAPCNAQRRCGENAGRADEGSGQEVGREERCAQEACSVHAVCMSDACTGHASRTQHACLDADADTDADTDTNADADAEERGGAGKTPCPFGPGLKPAPASRPPQPPETGKSAARQGKNGHGRVRESPEAQSAAEKGPIRAPMTGAPTQGEVPDPADLTVKQIQALELEEAGWEVLQAREEAGRGRASALGHIERMLNKAPPAVVVYQQVADIWPGRKLWDKVGRVVGEDPDNLAFWEEVVIGYLLCGWNKLNIGAMIEFYGRREIPPGKRLTGSGRAAAEPKSALEDYEEWVREQGEAYGDAR
jgi:hypothetical protein